MKTNRKNGTEPKQGEEKMVFAWANYKWMLVGVALLVVGFVLMAGGGSSDPNVFDAERLFAWRRIGLAPMVVLLGFGVVGYSIMRRPRGNGDGAEKRDR